MKNRQVRIVLLAVLTFILGGIAIFAGNQLINNQAPTDSEASATSCSTLGQEYCSTNGTKYRCSGPITGPLNFVSVGTCEPDIPTVPGGVIVPGQDETPNPPPATNPPSAEPPPSNPQTCTPNAERCHESGKIVKCLSDGTGEEFTNRTCGTSSSSDSNGDDSQQQATTSRTCYRCSAELTDGNTCSPFTTTLSSCPAGTSSTNSGCSTAVGGSCPIQNDVENTPPPVPITSASGSNTITCYSCTPATNDGGACEPFTTTGSCPAGSSISPTGCSQASNMCAGEVSAIPNTSIFSDNFDRVISILFSMVLLVIAIKIWTLKSTKNVVLKTNANEVEDNELLQKKKVLKTKDRSRESFESRFQ